MTYRQAIQTLEVGQSLEFPTLDQAKSAGCVKFYNGMRFSRKGCVLTRVA